MYAEIDVLEKERKRLLAGLYKSRFKQTTQTGGNNMSEQIMKYIPKGKREAIKECFRDSDGYWIWLKPGWVADNSCAETCIHEDTIAELRYQISGIKRK